MAHCAFVQALGTAIASPLSDFQGFQLADELPRDAHVLSLGRRVSAPGAPLALQVLARINPLSYGVDGLRGALGGLSYFEPATDIAVLAAVLTALLFLGGYLFSRIEL